MLDLRATGGQLEPTIFRAWVVSLPGRYLGAHLLQGLYKYIAAGPAFGQHQHLRGAAHIRGIHEIGGGGILSLITQFLVAVGSRYDDERRDIAELGGDGLLEQWLMALHARLALWPRWSPDDIVVGFIGTGDMHLIDVAVVDEVATFIGTAVHHRKEILPDGFGKSLLNVGPEIGIDRVHLEQNDFALVEHLGADIHRPYGGNVSGAEHQHHAAIMVRLSVEAGGVAL